MTAAKQMLETISAAHALLDRERELLSRGDYAGMAGLAGEKQVMLRTLEDLIRQASGERTNDGGSRAELRAALSALIDDSRRNERLIQAARQGVAGARRRIETILATRHGAVAYDRHGAPISSREDTVSESSRA